MTTIKTCLCGGIVLQAGNVKFCFFCRQIMNLQDAINIATSPQKPCVVCGKPTKGIYLSDTGDISVCLDCYADDSLARWLENQDE